MAIFVDNRLVSEFKFSGGEVHVTVQVNPEPSSKVIAYLNSSDDVMALIMVVDALRRVNPDVRIELTIPYFPYARQDRVCNPGESLSVKVMADLINSLNCTSVTVYDPHSDVTPALLHRCKVESLASLVMQTSLPTFIYENDLTLVSPDAGAQKKTQELARRLSLNGCSVKTLCATKTRDTLTGKIVATEITGDVQGKNLILLDDICDGGQTFIELAQMLKAKGAAKLYLYITHGIFSKGLAPLKDHFTRVYCYYPITGTQNVTDPFLTSLS